MSKRLKIWPAYVLTTSVLFLCGLVTPGRADPTANNDLSQIKSYIDNLGYTSSISGSSVTTSISGKYNYAFYFTPSADDTIIYVSVFLFSFSDEQEQKMPFAKILSFNNTHVEYYALGKSGSQNILILYSQVATCSLSPRLLRTTLDRVLGDLDGSTTMVDPTTWK